MVDANIPDTAQGGHLPQASSSCLQSSPWTLRPPASLAVLLLTYMRSGPKPEDTACPSCLTCVIFPTVPAAPAVSRASLSGRLRCSSNSAHSAQPGHCVQMTSQTLSSRSTRSLLCKPHSFTPRSWLPPRLTSQKAKCCMRLSFGPGAPATRLSAREQ